MDTETTDKPPPIPANATGPLIKAARVAKGITQAQLAELVGTGRGNISNIEDRRRACGDRVLDRIVHALRPLDPDTKRKIREAHAAYNPWGA